MRLQFVDGALVRDFVVQRKLQCNNHNQDGNHSICRTETFRQNKGKEVV